MKQLIVILFCCFIVGCTTQAKTGNFAKKEVKNFYLSMQTISTETVDKLSDIYPPAKSRLRLKTPDKHDYFGIFFLNNLRNKGYAVLEGDNFGNENYYFVDYVIRNSKENNTTYNVIINIGNSTLSRVYIVDKKGDLVPNSSWTLRN